MQGTIFDIEEFSVHDGPGIRTAVFFKGCPLRCRWCHNPEGLSAAPQRLKSPNGCTGCGACKAVCPHPKGCTGCGACVAACPRRLIRIAGQRWQANALAAELLRHADILNRAGGGVTCTGGEVLMQPAFLAGVLDKLKGRVHRAIQTSGYAPGAVFEEIIRRCELVMFDLKAMDDTVHKACTGVSNVPILENLERLKKSGVPFIPRIPLVPGVNDNEAHFEGVAAVLKDAPNLVRVEVMPFNPLAGAKYAMAGMPFEPGLDVNAPAQKPFAPLEKAGIPYVML